MTRIAIPHWQGRVSPVFDVAERLLVIDVQNGRELHRVQKNLNSRDPLSRARSLARFGTDILICCAISVPLRVSLRSAGVRIVADICGPIEDVIEAFLDGTLPNSIFCMPPGSSPGRGRFRKRRGW